MKQLKHNTRTSGKQRSHNIKYMTESTENPITWKTWSINMNLKKSFFLLFSNDRNTF